MQRCVAVMANPECVGSSETPQVIGRGPISNLIEAQVLRKGAAMSQIDVVVVGREDACVIHPDAASALDHAVFLKRGIGTSVFLPLVVVSAIGQEVPGIKV